MALSKMVFMRNHYIKVRERASSIHAQKVSEMQQQQQRAMLFFFENNEWSVFPK
jgi:hypothetical protein